MFTGKFWYYCLFLCKGLIRFAFAEIPKTAPPHTEQRRIQMIWIMDLWNAAALTFFILLVVLRDHQAQGWEQQSCWSALTVRVICFILT